jgi:pectate lyase
VNPLSLLRPRPLRRAACLLAWVLMLGLGVMAAPRAADAGPCATSGVPGTPYEGFGAGTPGGAGKAVYRVTTLADSGPGSLRDALAAGHRCVVFDVAGVITLRSQLYVRGAFVTVDGFSAPAPGITLRGYGLSAWGTHGAHDVIVRGLRVRDAGQATCEGMTDHDGQCWDGIQIKNGASRVVIDHVSIDNASDGALDITGSSDVTVQWSILSGTAKQSLIGESPRVSMHHNLFIEGQTRQPQVGWSQPPAGSTRDVDLDLRNNVIWGFSAYGTIVRSGALANVVNNYYSSPSRTLLKQVLVVEQARVHAAGNHSGQGVAIDTSSTDPRAFAAAPVTTTEACPAAYEVVEAAGARGINVTLDAIDRGYLDDLPTGQLPGCAGAHTYASRPSVAPAPSSAPTTPVTIVETTPASPGNLAMAALDIPGTVYTDVKFPLKFALTNRGGSPSPGARVRVHLAASARPSASDLILRDRYVAPITPGATQWHAITEIVPPEVRPGAYYLLLTTVSEGAPEASRSTVAAAPVAVNRPVPSTPIPDLVTAGVSVPPVLQRGVGFPVKLTVVNRGTGRAQASRLHIYLSSGSTVSKGSVLLRNRAVGVLEPDASQTHALTEVVNGTIKPGAYYVLLVVDATAVVDELNERNNVTAIPVTVR